FTFVPGSTVDLEFSMDIHLTQRRSDTESPQVLGPPITRQTIRLSVDDVDEAGATVSFEVLDAGIDPTDTLLTDAQILQLTAALQSAIGLRGTMTIDPRGAVRSITYDDGTLSTTASTQLYSLDDGLASVVPVLPAEPIGRGARW